MKCLGTGTPGLNVTRAWIGDLCPMVGDCQICGQRVRISKTWCVLTHEAA